MLPRYLKTPGFFLAFLFLVAACQPKIGDECITNQDCDSAGKRLCDSSQPDGYCTQANCDPTSCPEDEAICVAFNNTPSSVGACNTPDRTSPYRRTFCMAMCDDDGDCRPGYDCVDLTKKNIWSATVIEEIPEDGVLSKTACILAESRAPIEDERKDQVCTGWQDEGNSPGLGGAKN